MYNCIILISKDLGFLFVYEKLHDYISLATSLNESGVIILNSVKTAFESRKIPISHYVKNWRNVILCHKILII